MARSRNGGNGRNSGNSPVHSLEFPTHGGRIDFAIWENTHGEGDKERIVYAVSFNRSYHDGKEWKDTKSVRTTDIPVVMHGLGKCYDWILEQSAR